MTHQMDSDNPTYLIKSQSTCVCWNLSHGVFLSIGYAFLGFSAAPFNWKEHELLRISNNPVSHNESSHELV